MPATPRAAERAWGRFKLAAVSSFAFVEAAGPIYVGKLIKDALGLKANEPRAIPSRLPIPHPMQRRGSRMAASILGAMSLTTDFAPLVLLAGHGANVVNNPHASGLHCGACGGYSGEVNARLLAGLLNDPEVRAGLAGTGIVIPADHALRRRAARHHHRRGDALHRGPAHRRAPRCASRRPSSGWRPPPC
jgi:uncharacterized protein YbcC (UPF0753/DUF2309 family)